MKPSARFLFVGLASVAILTAAAAVGVVAQARRLQQQHVIEQLQLAATAEAELQSGRLREMQLHGAGTVQDPAFVDYIVQSLVPSPKFGGGVDSASIADLLSERHAGYDVAMMLDSGGNPVAASGTLLKDDTSIKHEAVVTEAVGTRKATQGVWVDHGRLILVSATPLVRDSDLKGVLLIATRLDAGFANAIRRIVRTDVVLIVPAMSGPGLSTSDGVQSWVGPVLTARLPQILAIKSPQGEVLPLFDEKHTTTAWVSPLAASGGSAALVALDPNHDDDGLIQDDAMPLLELIITIGVVAALMVLLQWRRTYLPLQAMRDLIDRAANGDRNLSARAEGSPIVLYLRDAINRLLKNP